MRDLKLPKELTLFLKSGKQLDYDSIGCEPGLIRLLGHDELKSMLLWVSCETATFSEEDPNHGNGGCYSVPGVNLVAECEGYDPEGILMWLPDTTQFGSFDCDHAILHVFPGATWADIAADPVPYVNCQWAPDDISNEIYKPWPRHAFREGWYGGEDPSSA